MQDEASEYSASVAESHVTNPELRATASDYVAGILKQSQSTKKKTEVSEQEDESEKYSEEEEPDLPEFKARITEIDSKKMALEKMKQALAQMNIEPYNLFAQMDANHDGRLDIDDRLQVCCIWYLRCPVGQENV